MRHTFRAPRQLLHASSSFFQRQRKGISSGGTADHVSVKRKTEENMNPLCSCMLCRRGGDIDAVRLAPTVYCTFIESWRAMRKKYCCAKPGECKPEWTRACKDCTRCHPPGCECEEVCQKSHINYQSCDHFLSTPCDAHNPTTADGAAARATANKQETSGERNAAEEPYFGPPSVVLPRPHEVNKKNVQFREEENGQASQMERVKLASVTPDKV